MSALLNSLVSKFNIAFEANRDKLIEKKEILLLSADDSRLITPAIRFALEKAKEASSLPELSRWLGTCTETTHIEAVSSESRLMQIWSTLHVFRLLSVGRPAGPEPEWKHAAVSAVCRMGVFSVPNHATHFTDSLEFRMRIACRGLPLEVVGAAISGEGPAVKAGSCVLPDWMKPHTWPQMPVPFTAWNTSGSDSVATISLWQAVSLEAVSTLQFLLGSDWPSIALSVSNQDVQNWLRLWLSLCSPFFPWNDSCYSASAEKMMPSFPLEGQDRGADQLLEHTTWCRKVVKMASSDQKMVVLLASFRMLGPIRYPFVTADVLGHFIPMLLPLVEDYRASIQWIGYSVLDCLLRACVSTSLVPYKPMLSEILRRGTASTDPTVLGIVFSSQVYFQYAAVGAPPHAGFDKCFTDVVEGLGLQSKVAMQVTLFASLSNLAAAMGIHFARHLNAFLDIVQNGVVSGVSAPVALAALTALEVVCVACWPRMTDERLSSKVAMLCQHSKDHASKYDASAQEAIPDWENAIEATAVLIQQFLAKLTFTE